MRRRMEACSSNVRRNGKRFQPAILTDAHNTVARFHKDLFWNAAAEKRCMGSSSYFGRVVLGFL
jgi:hypothetical protein